MGVAAYNRGTRAVIRAADERMSAANARTDRARLKDEIVRLREQVAGLEADLSRARRCLASERHGRDLLRLRLAESERNYQFAVSTLCRRVFPGDES